MKKSNLIKICSILVIAVMIALILGTTVNAVDTNNGYTDMTDSLLGGSSNNTAGNTNNTDNTSNRNANNNALNTNTNANTNNTSIYTNNNLPNTGIESSIPVALLVVIFAISSVYAYKKINDYKNV